MWTYLMENFFISLTNTMFLFCRLETLFKTNQWSQSNSYVSATWQERIDIRFGITHSFVQVTGPGTRRKSRYSSWSRLTWACISTLNLHCAVWTKCQIYSITCFHCESCFGYTFHYLRFNRFLKCLFCLNFCEILSEIEWDTRPAFIK